MTAFLILLFIVVFVLAFDIVPKFYVWQSRIHIGRWPDKDIWRKTLSGKALQWLKNTPTIRLTDNDRLIFWDIIRGNYKRSAIQHWQQAALLLGLNQAYEKTGDATIKKQVDDFIASVFDSSGNWKHMPQEVDGVILAYSILKTSWIDHEKYRPAYDGLWKFIQDMTGSDGTVEYRKHMKDFRYVDTIGFICPFLVRYGMMTGNEQSVSLAVTQIAEFNRRGMYPGQFIPCHTYNINSEIPVGLFGWGRGLGWYAIGLIDAWDELPADHPQKKELTDSVRSFAQAIMKLQNPNGGWGWIAVSKNSMADSSATATLSWFLSRAATLDEIKEQCNASAGKATKYLMKTTRRDGAVDLSQGDTKGIGVYSQHFDILPFTQGFALRTAYL